MIKRRLAIVSGSMVTVFAALAFSAKSDLIDAFKIQNQIAGWVDDHTSHKAFTPEQLFGIIDGGASEYIDNGMQKGFFQRLKGPDSATMELFAEDFGSAENAQKIRAIKRMVFSDSQSIKNSDTSGIVVNEVIGGLWACGIVGRFYFELTLMGIKDGMKAKTVVRTYFEYYRKTAAVSAHKK